MPKTMAVLRTLFHDFLSFFIKEKHIHLSWVSPSSPLHIWWRGGFMKLCDSQSHRSRKNMAHVGLIYCLKTSPTCSLCFRWWGKWRKMCAFNLRALLKHFPWYFGEVLHVGHVGVQSSLNSYSHAEVQPSLHAYRASSQDFLRTHSKPQEALHFAALFLWNLLACDCNCVFS